MSTSSPRDDNYTGITADAWPGEFHAAGHGHEPGQRSRGKHPASVLLGYSDDPSSPDHWTVRPRDLLDSDEIVTHWLTIDYDAVVDLEVMR